MLTQHNDNSRTSENLSETVLNTTNVNQNSFGRLYTRAVDDQIYAQPLYVTGVSIPGKGTHNVVYVATVNDSVYAFDADDATAAAYWQDSFINLANNIRPVFHTDVGQACGVYLDFSGNIGIVSTPVIDKATNTMYLVARTVEGTGQSQQFVQRLHALDITTGAEKFGGPVTINASVPGTGAGSSNGMIPFNPQTENQRAALALYNGKVIIAWASHCDTGPYHGWVMAYNASTLAQVWAMATTANGSNGGIWQSGNGPAIDANGNIYYSVGNGTVNPTSGQYGESMIRISASTGQVMDYFVPNDYQQLENGDIDFGSAGPLLVPGSRTLVTGSKEGEIFLLNADNLGHLNTTTDQSLQEFQVTPNFGSDKIHGTPVYYKDSSNNQWVYVWGSNDKLKQFQFNGTIFSSTTPTHVSNVTVNPNPSMPGGVMAVSSNGQTAGSGILWATTVLSGNANNDVRPGILRAFNASDVSAELWNSQQNAARDDFGNLAKFNTPTVDNGRVYLPTFSNELVVYGQLAGLPAAPASLTATVAANGVDIDLSWAAVSGAAQYTIERRSGSSGNFIPVATVNAPQTTYHDAGLQGGTMYTYRVRAQNSIGASAPIEATATTVLTKQLLARYKFDENTGTMTADSSGNNNTATLSPSGTTWTTGRFGSALAFDGTANTYVTAPNSASLNPPSQMSVVAWVNPTSWTGGNRRILQKGSNDNQYRLTEENSVLKWHIANVGTVQTSTLPSTGAWHLVVGTYDGSNLTLYIDGAQVATVAASGSIPVTTDQLVIGSKNPNSTAGDHFNGNIDEVRIYNYALSSSEVTTLNAGAAPAAPTGLMLSAPSPSNVAVLWNDVASNEAGYLVERRAASGGAYAQIASLPAGTTGYNDTGLPAFTTFFYRVRAYNIFDFSAYTPEQSVTTQGAAIHSLVARFPLDESSGTTLTDASGHGVTLSTVGSPTHPTDTADASSHSLGLNGSTDWAQAVDNAALDMTNGLTLAAWVRADAWDQTRPIVEKGSREAHYLLEADQGMLKFDLSGQGTLSAPLPTTGAWHYLAATYDGAAMKIYVDGLFVASRAASGAMDTTTDPFFIGGSHASSSTGLAFDGKLDDVRVYNYALSATDVSALYGNIALLKFDEGSGNMAFDSTPNNNNGALTNGPTWAYSRDGLALNFAGGQYVSLINNQTLNPTAALSVGAWIDAANWTGTPTILQKGATTVQYRLYASSGNLIFDVPGVGSISTALPSANAWHFVAGTYNGHALALYVDGVQRLSSAATGTIATTNDTLLIGAPSAGAAASQTFHGLIDDVRLFSRGLTSDEVADQFAAPTIDLTPPTVTSAGFAYETSPNAVSMMFSEDVSASLSSISILNLTTNSALVPTGYSYNAGTHTATFTLAAPLVDGNYRATLDATKVQDASGNQMASNFIFDFFFLDADANRDRMVDTLDFNPLATNFGQTGKTFSQGNFNYDGVIDTIDFNILAAQFTKQLPAPPPLPAVAAQFKAPFAREPVQATGESKHCSCGCGMDDDDEPAA